MSDALVSVGMPTRDRAAFLGEAIDSVFAQSLGEIELIVVDDASSDRTAEILASRRERRLKVVRHEQPSGVARCRNLCLELARGRYVAWLDSDDAYLPGMLATQVAALEAAPRAVLAHGAFAVIDGRGEALPDWPRPFPGDGREKGQQAFRELVCGNYIGAPTVVVRRSAQRIVGRYRESLKSAEDWEMWMRLALAGDLLYCARPLARYRWHAGSLSRTAERDGSRFRRELAALEGLFERNAWRLPDAPAVEQQGRAALAARAIVAATEAVTRGARLAAARRVGWALRAAPRLARGGRGALLLAAAFAGREIAWHRRSSSALATLAWWAGPTRAGARLRRHAMRSERWQKTLEEIARAMRESIPERARVAVADKWDPTLLALANRRGWNFPDRRSFPDGYPADSDAAVAHLEELAARGASYFVLPSSSFWWLESYPGLRDYLERAAEPVRSEASCSIFRLGGSDAGGAPGARRGESTAALAGRAS